MKTKILLTILVLAGAVIYGQGLTKSAEKESTILFRGNTINFDMGASELAIGVNNLKSSMGRQSKFVWGAHLKAKNETGLANLFSEGDMVPGGSINGFVGWSWSNGVPTAYRPVLQGKINRYKSLISQADSVIKTAIKNSLRNDTAMQRKLIKALSTSRTREGFIDSLADLKSGTTGYRTEFVTIAKESRDGLKNIIVEARLTTKEMNDVQKEINKEDYCQWILFAYGGLTSADFTRFLAFNDADYSKSFQDTIFNGKRLGLGANFQCGSSMFGLTAGYLKTNNFSLLKKSDYTLRTTKQNTSGQSLIREKKISAFSGDYAEISMLEINADYTLRIKMSDDSKMGMLINPYARVQANSSNKKLLPNTINLGGGVYFFKTDAGKFLGGLYVELPDVQNNYEKLKPVEDQELKSPFKRITFGIVSRFTIASALNMF